MSNEYINTYLNETRTVLENLDRQEILNAIEILSRTRENAGRLFILGIGGSASNASHAVNDFRKIAGIESYTPVDNVAELTARTNDDGFDTIFVEWLQTSKLCSGDTIMVFSVGGGSETTSKNLVRAMQHAKNMGSKIIAVVSRDGGCAKEMADACIMVPVVSEKRITPHAEGWQGIIWHLMVNALV